MTLDEVETAGFFRKLVIQLTDKCNLHCAHCMPESGPRRTEIADQADLHSWIEQAGKIEAIRILSFTGGEPFLGLDRLYGAVEAGRLLGLHSLVMSNGYWARTFDRAVGILDRLPGLVGLGISTDRFHWVEVPIDRVKNAIRAASALGKLVLIRACYTTSVDDEIEEVRERLGDCLALVDRFEVQPVLGYGRATQLAPESLVSFSDVEMSCRVADSPLILPSGRVFACCGPSVFTRQDGGLYLGNLREESLASIYQRAQRNVALHIIRTRGPSRLLQEVCRRSNGSPPPHGRSICDTCLAASRLISSNSAQSDLNGDAGLRREVGAARLLSFGEHEMLAETSDHLDD